MIHRGQNSAARVTTGNPLEACRTGQPERLDAERLVLINLSRRQKGSAIGQEDPLIKGVRCEMNVISWRGDVTTPVSDQMISLQGRTFHRCTPGKELTDQDNPNQLAGAIPEQDQAMTALVMQEAEFGIRARPSLGSRRNDQGPTTKISCREEAEFGGKVGEALADPLHRCALGKSSGLVLLLRPKQKRKLDASTGWSQGKRQFRRLNMLQLQLVIERGEAALPDPEVVLEQGPLIQH